MIRVISMIIIVYRLNYINHVRCKQKKNMKFNQETQQQHDGDDDDIQMLVSE